MKKRSFLFTLFVGSLILSGIYACSSNDGYEASADGKGGSMARFAIAGDYLYTVDHQTLRTVRLTDPQHPEYLELKDQNLGFDIETIFPYDNKLFIGSQTGMYIYDIERPEFPQLLSRVSHFTSCDPVVAEGDYAYLTLNSDNMTCWRGSNELQVYDITDLKRPFLVYADRSLNSPKGLGIDAAAARLFVCDRGVKVYDLSDPAEPRWCDDLTNIPEARGIETYDCIPMNGLLLVIGKDGLYQFDYRGENLSFVSKIDLRK